MRVFRRAVVITLLVCAPALGWHAVREINYRAGLLAFQRGDYAAARLILPAFAREGRVEAEHAMGLMELAGRRAGSALPGLRAAPAPKLAVATVREAPLPVLKMAANPAMQSLELGLRDLSGQDNSRRGLDIRL